MAAKLSEDQLAFQKLMKEQMDKRLRDLEDRPVSAKRGRGVCE
jgi:hypothetical protein